MRTWTIDFDIIKIIFRCKYVKAVHWRTSASGKGFHYRWDCTNTEFCMICAMNENTFDDPVRHVRDQNYREAHQRRVLWDRKGDKYAGPWHIVKREKNVTRTKTT